MRLRVPRPHLILITITITTLLGCLSDALVHEQVAFDSSDVCWWSLTPPDPVCPVLKQQNLTELLLHDDLNKKSSSQWQGGTECERSYCLYANRGFAAGRGIAIITTPADLAKVKQVGDLLQEYKVSFAADDSEDVPFRSARIEGKSEGEGEGEGEAVMVAASALKRGDPIMAHTPVLLVHQTFGKEAPRERQRHLLNLAVQSLPEATAKKLLGRIDILARSSSADDARILSAHSFQVNLGSGSDKDDNDNDNGKATHLHDGVFPEAATITHDCRPNTAAYVDPTTLMHITTAVQPIQPGEPLTLSHLPNPFATRAERQTHAHARWGQGCTCRQCTLADSSEEAAADSETRLGEIRWINAKLHDPTSAQVSTGIISYYLGLHENEKLHCCLAGAYALAATNFNMLGYEKYAVKYADLAVEAFKMEKGESVPEEVRAMQTLRGRPREHPTWKQRTKAKPPKQPSEPAPEVLTDAATVVTPTPTSAASPAPTEPVAYSKYSGN